MALFDSDKTNRVTRAVQQSNHIEQAKKEKKNHSTPELKNKVGRPPITDEQERKKSYPVTMTKSMMDKIERYKELNYPSLSRSAVIVELLEEILEMKG